jgi:hypothetical protein
MSVVPSIGFFQLDNLLKTKVPFLLVNLDVDLSSNFKGNDLQHLETYQLKMPSSVKAEELEKAFLEKKIPKHYPIVFVCQDGVRAKELAEKMDDMAWMNCFFVFQGLVGLAERE